MKATLEFDLNDPDDIMAHKRAVASTDLALCLVDIKEQFRMKIKYQGDDMSEEEYAVWEKMQSIFFQCMEDNGIVLDNIIN